MQTNDLVLVSVDDHIVEPPDMFVGRMPKRYEDQAPRVVRNDDGTDAWVFDGKQAAHLGLNAVAGRPREEYGLEPTSYDEFRRGCYDVHERVKDMSANGVLGSMNFPSFPRFCGQWFAEAAARDAGLAISVVRAYNDWHVEEWCGTYPDRFIPLGLVPLWDPALMRDEVLRLSAMGCHAVTFSMNPYKLGLPSLHTDNWDPFWSACAEAGTVVCVHIGSDSYTILTSPDAPMDVRSTCAGVSLYSTAADFVFGPMFQKFPQLRVALSEGGIGWIPYFLERADYTFQHHNAWTGTDLGGRLPSEIFRMHMAGCFIDDQVGLENLGWLNEGMVMWECDYPHSDSTWPNSPETVTNSVGHLDDELIDRITHLNAMDLFQFEPFRYRKRDDCTVGALRAEVATHDISVVSRGKRERRYGATQAGFAAAQGVPDR